MSQAARLTALAQAMGADIKALQAAGPGGSSTAYAVPSYAGARTKPFNPVTSMYNVTPTSMAVIRDKLAESDTSRVGISLWGHSIMAGAFGVIGQSDLASQIRKNLTAMGAKMSGSGFISIYQSMVGYRDAEWIYDSFVDSGQANWPWAYSTAPSAIATYNSREAGSIVDVAFLTGMGYGPVEVTIDNVIMETYDPGPGVAGAIVIRSYPGLTNTPHNISLRSTTASPAGTVILGVQVRQSAGIEVSNHAMGGSQTVNWLPSGAVGENWNIALNSSRNDIVILSVAGNDLIQNLSLTTCKSNMQSIISTLQASSKAVILCVETPGQTYEEGNTGFPGISQARLAQWRSMQYDLADQFDIPLFDMSHMMVSYANMVAQGWSGDAFHPNGIAYSILGRNLTDAILRPERKSLDLRLSAQEARQYQPNLLKAGPTSTDITSVVTGAAADATLNQQYVIGANLLPAIWPIDAWGDIRVSSNTYMSTTSNTSVGNAISYRMMTDAPKICVYAYGAGFMADLYIDGRPYASNPITLANTTGLGTYGYHVITFPSAKPRLIEWRSVSGIVGVLVAKPYRIWKPAPDPNPKVAIVGDSYVLPTIMNDAAAGQTAVQDYLRGIYQRMDAALGISYLITDGVGGTGYINPGGNSLPYVATARLAWLTRVKPDVVVVHGGGANDLYGGNTQQATIDAAVNYFKTVRLVLPRAKLVFVEGFAPPIFQYNTQYKAIRQAVQAALIAAGVDVYYVDVATTNPVLNGTGYVTAANGTGNTDIYIGSDQAHPTIRGHEYIRAYLASKLKAILADRGELINTLI